MAVSETRKIFKTLPLGEMSASATSAREPKELVSVSRPRKASVAKTPEIPTPPAYRVHPLGRGSASLSAAAKWRTEAMRSHRSPTLLW
jgi:AraC family transcriptional regulator, transcriptional activator of pobA